MSRCQSLFTSEYVSIIQRIIQHIIQLIIQRIIQYQWQWGSGFKHSWFSSWTAGLSCWRWPVPSLQRAWWTCKTYNTQNWGLIFPLVAATTKFLVYQKKIWKHFARTLLICTSIAFKNTPCICWFLYKSRDWCKVYLLNSSTSLSPSSISPSMSLGIKISSAK